MESASTSKRSFGDVDGADEVNNYFKKFKTDHFRLSYEKIKNDKKKWNMLPAVVYHLLTLFKKSGKSDGDDKEKKQKKNVKDINELKVLPNQNQQEKILDVAKIENQNDYESLKIISEKPNVELVKTVEPQFIPPKSIKDDSKNTLDELGFFNNQIKDIKIKKSIKINIKTKCMQNIEKNDVQRVEQKEDEQFEKTNVINKPESNIYVPTNIILDTPNPIQNISSSNAKIDNSKTDNVFRAEKAQDFLKKLCEEDISKVPITKPPSCICKFCMYVDNLPIENSAGNNYHTSYNCSNLPYNNPNNNVLHSDMYSSNITVSDCSVCASKGIYTTNDCSCEKKSDLICNWQKQSTNVETPTKDIWVNDLVSMMRINEMKYKAPKVSNKKLRSLLKQSKTSFKPAKKKSPLNYFTSIESTMSKVQYAAEQIKLHLPLCKDCNKSIPSNSSICDCNANHITYKGKYNQISIKD